MATGAGPTITLAAPGDTATPSYDPASNTWDDNLQGVSLRSRIAVAAFNGVLYIIGGHNNGPLTTVEAYDPSTGTSTLLPSISIARSGLGGVEINGIIYAVGGIGAGGSGAAESFVP